MTHTCLFTSFGSNKLGWAGVFFLLKRQFVTLWNADILQCIQTNRNCMLATCMCVNNSCLSTFFLLLGVQTCQPRRACCIYASKIIRHPVLLFYIYGTLEMCTVSIWHAFLASISGKCHMQFGKKKENKSGCPGQTGTDTASGCCWSKSAGFKHPGVLKVIQTLKPFLLQS